MALSELGKLLVELEKAELEAPSGSASTETYAQLLAAYLYQDDLCNAKYLRKRIPSSRRNKSTELGQRDWLAVHAALNAEWSEDINGTMNALKDNAREASWSDQYGRDDRIVVGPGSSSNGRRNDGSALQTKSQRTKLTEDQLYKLTQ